MKEDIMIIQKIEEESEKRLAELKEIMNSFKTDSESNILELIERAKRITTGLGFDQHSKSAFEGLKDLTKRIERIKLRAGEYKAMLEEAQSKDDFNVGDYILSKDIRLEFSGLKNSNCIFEGSTEKIGGHGVNSAKIIHQDEKNIYFLKGGNLYYTEKKLAKIYYKKDEAETAKSALEEKNKNLELQEIKFMVFGLSKEQKFSNIKIEGTLKSNESVKKALISNIIKEDESFIGGLIFTVYFVNKDFNVSDINYNLIELNRLNNRNGKEVRVVYEKNLKKSDSSLFHNSKKSYYEGDSRKNIFCLTLKDRVLNFI